MDLLKTLSKTTTYGIVFLYVSYAYLFFYDHGITSFKPLYVHFTSLCLIAGLFIMKRERTIPKISNSLLLWVLVYLCFNIFSFFLSSQSELAEDALSESLMTSALLLGFFFLLQDQDSAHYAGKALVLVVFLSVVLNFYDFFSAAWTKVPGRGAGMFVDPTISGKVVVMAMVASIPVIPTKHRIPYCLVAWLGIFITFSRGPWLFWIVAILGLAIGGYFSLQNRKSVVVIIATVGVIILYGIFSGIFLDFAQDLGYQKYLTAGTISRLGGDDTAFSDLSATTRLELAKKAWQTFTEHPLLGAGLGYEREWDAAIGSHNTFLMMASQGGIVGLGVFLALLVVLWRSADDLGKILLVVYMFSCLTSHDNLRQPALLVFLALIATSGRNWRRIRARDIEQEDEVVANEN